jgi:hypothetical protein
MSTPNVDASIKNPTHHISLEDGTNTVGLTLVDARGNENPLAMQRFPVRGSTILNVAGRSKFTDYEPPYDQVEQRDWSGGRGMMDFDDDASRFFDSYRADTIGEGQIINGPLEIYGTGIRNALQNTLSTTPDEYMWVQLYGKSQYQATQITGDGMTADKIYITFRKVGSPSGNLVVAIWSDTGANVPYQELVSKSITPTSITDIASQRAAFDFTGTQTLSSGIKYWVVVYSDDNNDTSTNHWEVLCRSVGNTTMSGTNTGSLSWATSSARIIYRVVDADSDYEALFFEYKGSLFAVVNYESTTTPKIFINGDQGVSSGSNTANTLNDTSKSWTTNEWAGSIVLLTTGTGSEERWAWREIESNTATQLTIKGGNWWTVPDSSTEYAIICSDKWTEITGHGMTEKVIDVISVMHNVYFTQGDDTYIMRMRRFNSGGTWTTEWVREVIDGKGGQIQWVGRQDGYMDIWLARHGYEATVRKAEGRWGGGGSNVNDTQQGTLSYQGNDKETAEFRDTLQDFSDWQSQTANSKDSEQGTLSYQGGDNNTAEFRDTDQDFSEWESLPDNHRALYKIVVTNSDGTVSWGYLGLANDGAGTNDDVDVYTDELLLTRGWNGTAPVAGSKTPSSYVIVDTADERAAHLLIVKNSDGTISWGYMGLANNGAGTNDDINIYKDVGLAVRGWNGTAPVAGSKTPSSYQVVPLNKMLQFSPETLIGEGRERITGLGRYGEPERLWVFKTGSVYEVEGNPPFDVLVNPIPLREMHNVETLLNGRAHTVNGVYLFFNLLDGLERYYKSNLDDVGPNRDEGLPDDRKGVIVDLVSYPGRLYAALDGGTNNYSSILCYNQSGWHEIYRAPEKGKRIRNLYLQATQPLSKVERLWFTEGSDIVWLPISLRPYYDDDYRYTHETIVETGWFNMGFVDIPKFFKSIKLLTEGYESRAVSVSNLDNTNYVNLKGIYIDYQTDTAAPTGRYTDTGWTANWYPANTQWTWTPLSTMITTSPFQEVNLSSSDNVSGKRIKYRLRIQTPISNMSAKVRAFVVKALLRVPVKWGYRVVFRVSDWDKTLEGQVEDSYQKAETKISQLDTWAASATPLTMRSVWSGWDNIKVMIDPASLRPYVLKPGDAEGHVLQATLIEV